MFRCLRAVPAVRRLAPARGVAGARPKLQWTLNNLDKVLSFSLNEGQVARAKTIFLKRLAVTAHKFYSGKMQTIPKAPVPGFNWFNVWYTPGVSSISTGIRDNVDASFELSNRGNLVAVISDSTRVLGDGDCGPAGGLGVMEGKAFLMKYLGGFDATAICVNSYNNKGKHDPDKIIEFCKMIAPSFGAINLEDISQPNCFKVLDELQCLDIPVWHDDAQGTACVTLAGLINALKIVDKDIAKARIVLNGAGASNITIARFILAAGADPANLVLFDTKGSLHKGRADIEKDKAFYRKWEMCLKTNPQKAKNIEEACKGADVLISLSTPGPDIVKEKWVSSMAKKAIVFACANPVPEIYPYAAKRAGAHIVATGRGDFPNQVNNSIGFPGILKGALMVRAKSVTDHMAIAAATSLAKYAEARGINENSIVATMDEPGVFPHEAADVAMAAIKDGVARTTMTHEQAYKQAEIDIKHCRDLTHAVIKGGFIKAPPENMLEEAVDFAINEAKKPLPKKK